MNESFDHDHKLIIPALYESNDENLIQSLPRLPIVDSNPFGPDEAYMYSSIWARRGSMKKEKVVYFPKSGLTDELLDIMARNLKDRKIEVSRQ